MVPSVSFSAWTVPLREGSQNESRPNDYVAQITDAFDVHDGLVAWVEVAGGVRGAGHDDVARQQRGERRNGGNLLGDAVNQVRGTSSPFSVKEILASFQSRSSRITIHGPSGQEVSKPLARVHVGSMPCRSRNVTSLTQVKPST